MKLGKRVRGFTSLFSDAVAGGLRAEVVVGGRRQTFTHVMKQVFFLSNFTEIELSNYLYVCRLIQRVLEADDQISYYWLLPSRSLLNYEQ